MQNILIKIIFLFVLIPAQLVLAEVSDKEMNTFLSAIKEKEDKELLIASPQFEKCKADLEAFRKGDGDTDKAQKDIKNKLRDCVAKEVLGKDGDEDSEKKLTDLAKTMGLESYNKQAASSAKSMREYLSERLEEAIYGKKKADANKLTKLKKQKFVNHEIYYDLYAEQIGKNTLLEISRYCLENFGYEKKESFVGDIKKTTIGKTVQYLGLVLDDVTEKVSPRKSEKLIDEYQVNEQLKANPTVFYEARNKLTSFNWKDAKEYEVCTLDTDKECKQQFKDEDGNPKPYRSIHLVSRLKDAEFELSKDDKKKELIKNRYQACATIVIHNMCEVYRCNNIYNSSSPEFDRKYCKTLGIDKLGGNAVKDPADVSYANLNLDTSNTTGSMACNLRKRLEEYRVVLQRVKDIKAGDLDDLKLYDTRASGFDHNESYDGQYSPTGKSSFDNLTSIGSQELSKNVDAITKSEAEAKELREKCFDPYGDNKFKLKVDASTIAACEVLTAKLDQTKFDTIQLDTEAKAQARIKQINSLKNKTELEQFLKDNGLNKYIGRLNKLADDPTALKEIKLLIEQDYKSKRMALVDSLKAKFEKERKIKISEKGGNKQANEDLRNDVANQTIADIEQHKKRVEILFEYSNIVSSYLTLKDSDDADKEVGTSSTGRLAEVSTNVKLGDYFSSEDEGSGSKGGIDYLGAIAQILTIGEEKEDKTN